MPSAGGIAIGVVCFVYFAASFTIFLLTMILYHKNKKKLAEIPELEFRLPSCGWFVAYFFFLIFVMVFGLYQLFDVVQEVLNVYVVMAIFIVFALILNCPMFCTSQNCAMCRMSNIEGGAAYAQQMRENHPELYFHIECWHYYYHKRRQYTRSTLNTDQYFGIPYWADFTSPLFLPGGRLLVHVLSTGSIVWMDNSLDLLRMKLESQYSTYDSNYKITEHSGVSGVISDKIIMTGDSKKVPCMLNGFLRFLWIFFGFGLSLSIYIATVASVVRYNIVKKCSLCNWPGFMTYNIDYLSTSEYANSLETAKPCQQNPLPLVHTSYSGDGKVVPTDGTQLQPQGQEPTPLLPTVPQQMYPAPPLQQVPYPQYSQQAPYPQLPQPATPDEWLQPGQVVITIKRTMDMLETDIESLTNPYFVFRMNGNTVMTKTSANKDRIFNETLSPLQYDPVAKSKVVRIELWDEGTTESKLWAVGVFEIDKYMNSAKTEWHNLLLCVKDVQKNGTKHPKVELEIIYNVRAP